MLIFGEQSAYIFQYETSYWKKKQKVKIVFKYLGDEIDNIGILKLL